MGLTGVVLVAQSLQQGCFLITEGEASLVAQSEQQGSFLVVGEYCFVAQSVQHGSFLRVLEGE